jgi:HK97 gp10 family phage protein
MGCDISVKDDTDKFEMYLSEIKNDCELTETKMLKAAGEKAEEFVIANLNKHKRTIASRYKGRPAMADDVKLSIRTDKYGDKYAKVMGGKKTGTLWHIVNDGNLHSQPTHFLDDVMKSLDDNIDAIWEEAER